MDINRSYVMDVLIGFFPNEERFCGEMIGSINSWTSTNTKQTPGLFHRKKRVNVINNFIHSISLYYWNCLINYLKVHITEDKKIFQTKKFFWLRSLQAYLVMNLWIIYIWMWTMSINTGIKLRLKFSCKIKKKLSYS